MEPGRFAVTNLKRKLLVRGRTLLLGVDAHVVDEHLLGEDSAGSGEPGQSPPTATFRIKEGVIEKPSAAGGPLRLSESA